MIAALWAPLAYGYEQAPDPLCTLGYIRPINGDVEVYHMIDPDGDWDATMEAAMEDAIDQWDGGLGLTNRGFDWRFSRSSTNQGVTLNDGVTQVQDMSRWDMDLLGIQSGAAAALFREYTRPNCVMSSFDLVIVDDDEDYESWTWSHNLPSWVSDGNMKSLPAVLVHEFGHAMSLHHVFDLAVMEDYESAEIGGKLRLNEDEFVAMRAMKGDASTGKNFMISKWVSDDGTVSRNAREAWESDGAQPAWEVSPGGDLPLGSWDDEDDGPGPIAAIVNGTSSTYTSVPVHWTISSDTTCFDGDDLLVGYDILDMSSDLPDQIGPSWGEYRIPSTAATGPYWLCAGIDAYGTLSESDTTDNIIRSERLIVVVP